MTSDAKLLERWAAGDKDAGDELVERHMPTIYRFFRTKVPDGAEDLAQETFLGALERRAELEGVNFRAYLLAIARRRLYRRFRTIVRADKKHQIAAMSVDEMLPTPSTAFAVKDEVGVLLRALRTIPLDFQIVIELFYWEQMKMTDVATVLEVQPGTIKSRLSRAREALKHAIGEVEVEPGLRKSTSDRLEHWAERLRAQVLDSGSSGD